MRAWICAAAVAGVMCVLAGAAGADDRTPNVLTGAAGGAAVGTVVGGPVGTAVGAGIGALVGSSLPTQPSVVYEEPIAVGAPLPDSYTYYDVPKYPEYAYLVVNNRRVVVDRRTHRVVRVYP